MHNVSISLLLLLAFSCNRSRNPESVTQEQLNPALDGLIWTKLCSFQNWNESELVKTYALRQVSQNFLLDSDGKILAVNLRGEELLNTLEELLL